MNVTIEYPDFIPWWFQIALSLLLLAGFCALWLGSSSWAMRDAAERGKSGCLIGLLVFFTWPLGLLIWLAARPASVATTSPPPLPNASLSPGGWIGFSLLFFFIPFACVFVSSILFYVWRGSEPRKARQINRLGWAVFLLQALFLGVLLISGSQAQ